MNGVEHKSALQLHMLLLINYVSVEVLFQVIKWQTNINVITINQKAY